VSVLVGRAGTGKGVTISAAARAWQLEGNEVIAQRLQADAKLEQASTTDGLLYAVEKGHIRLDSKTVVIMDEAGMADSDRLSRLVKLTGERESKLLLAGDAAQLSSIGPGGLFKELEGKVPTAELTEVHRAHHEWEREAWERIRAGEPGPALAQYQAHDRLHIHDTRAQAAQAMVEDWEQTRGSVPGGQAVMITDASNRERDQMNAMAQERRARAGELGSNRVELPGKPYGLASGDEVMFTGQYRIPGSKRVENGITGTIVNAARDEDRVTINTREREPREVDVNTSEFSELSLGYAVHVHKGQGLTADLGHPHRRLAYRPRARLRRAQPRARANPALRLPRGPRRAGHGHRRDRTPRRPHAAQPRTGDDDHPRNRHPNPNPRAPGRARAHRRDLTLARAAAA